jgi:hypothetical protein
MRRRLFILAVVLLAATPVRGQTSPEPDQTATIKALLERVEQLERRVHDLETKQTATSASYETVSLRHSAAPQPASSQDVPAQNPEPTHQHDQVAAVQQAEVHYPSLQIHGFGDVDFAATDQSGTNSGFSLGQFDLHFASALSQKVSYFGETTFTATAAGTYDLQVERSIIRYDYNDYFKISFGKYHTPIGYWNTAFHHGAWLQTTIARPEMVRIGGTLTPVHFVGFLAEGAIPSGPLGLNYNVGVGNGRSTTISRAGDAGDNNNNRAWVANVFARPPALYGLQVGASAYRDKITLADGRNFREWITGAHVVWTKERPEFLAEFENWNHREVLTNVESNSQAFYVQVGYRLPQFERTLKPYYRFEYIHNPLSEQVFANQDLVESIVGVRYDITNYAAFKGEYRHTERQATFPHVNGLFIQTAFTF